MIQTETAIKGEEDDRSLGTGVIINDQGDILTSLQAVNKATRILITFAAGTHSGGTVILAQPENDIIVLRVTVLPQLFVPAVLENPGAMRVSRTLERCCCSIYNLLG